MTNLYYQNKHAPSGGYLYYSTNKLSDSDKNLLLALDALWFEIREVLLKCSDPGVAKTKLYWWKQELNKLSHKNAEHPLTQALQKKADTLQELPEVLDATSEWFDLRIFNEYREFDEHCKKTRGSILFLTYKMLTPIYFDEEPFLRELGSIIEQLELMHYFRYFMEKNHFPLSIEQLEITQVSEENLHDIKNPEKQKPLWQDWHEKLKARYSLLLEELPSTLRRTLLPHIILTELYFERLKLAAEAGYPLLREKTELTPLHTWWLTRKIRRREKNQ